MPKYEVIVPVVGCYLIEVEADSKASAIDTAFMEIKDVLDDGLLNIDVVRHVTTGNISHAPVNSAYATRID